MRLKFCQVSRTHSFITGPTVTNIIQELILSNFSPYTVRRNRTLFHLEFITRSLRSPRPPQERPGLRGFSSEEQATSNLRPPETNHDVLLYELEAKEFCSRIAIGAKEGPSLSPGGPIALAAIPVGVTCDEITSKMSARAQGNKTQQGLCMQSSMYVRVTTIIHMVTQCARLCIR